VNLINATSDLLAALAASETATEANFAKGMASFNDFVRHAGLAEIVWCSDAALHTLLELCACTPTPRSWRVR
jgi:hypothetical protein